LKLLELPRPSAWFLQPFSWTLFEPLLIYVESIGNGNISFPLHIEGDNKRLMPRSQESERSGESTNVGIPWFCAGLPRELFRLLSFPDLKSFWGSFSTLNVFDQFVDLTSRHGTVSVVILEALINFNPHATFIGEQLDEIVVFNHPNNTLLVELIRWLCCNLRKHWEHQTTFN
jgi:hypothetical protein